jgi:PAS domain S-box-containing protein
MVIMRSEQSLPEHAFAGPGEMRQRCRELDWGQTPLGPVEAWPASLLSAAQQVLAQPFPSALHWGSRQLLIYNDGMRSLFGWQHPDALGQPAQEVLTETWSIDEAVYARVLAGQSVVLEDQPLLLVRGGEFVNAWFTTGCAPVRDGAGSIAGVLVTVFETTTGVRSISVLRESEARQRFLLGLADRVRLLNVPADIEEAVARALAEYLAADRSYYVTCPEGTGTALISAEYAKPPLPSVAGTYRVADFPWMANACNAGRPVLITDVASETTLSADERRRLHALSFGAMLVAPVVQASRLVGALVVGNVELRRWTASEVALVEEVAARTWTALEQRRAEAALQASEARFRTFVDNVRDYAIFLVDTEGRITEWTAGAERLTGYAAAEVLGRSAALLYTAEDISQAEPLRELLEAEAIGRAEREARRVRKDGLRFWVNEIVTAVRDDDGKLAGFTIISRDLSEQRRSRELREDLLAAATAAQTEAQRANFAKDEFLGILGHELRTPLAAIMLWGAALRSGAVTGVDLGRAVDAILQSAQTQSRLVDDLLDLSRLSSGKLQLAPAPVQVDAVARAASDVVAPMAQAKQLALELQLAADLGSGIFDAARLQQIIWNLLSNAIKFTPAGGRVTLRVRRLEGVLEIEVEDNGEGIAPHFMPHVFERFRQADMGDTRQHAGLGIGLALSRHLVELQGGTIEAHSEGLGHGALFRVRLPWSAAPAVVADDDEPPPSGVQRLRGVTVLLVEDDANTREVMAWTLANVGAEVVSAGSGSEALGLLGGADANAAGRPSLDVIVSDLGLPEMSGYELIERAVQVRRSRGEAPLPACAVSAHVREADRKRAIDAGFDLYLAKPVTPEQLIEAVEDLRDVASSPRP